MTLGFRKLTCFVGNGATLRRMVHGARRHNLERLHPRELSKRGCSNSVAWVKCRRCRMLRVARNLEGCPSQGGERLGGRISRPCNNLDPRNAFLSREFFVLLQLQLLLNSPRQEGIATTTSVFSIL